MQNLSPSPKLQNSRRQVSILSKSLGGVSGISWLKDWEGNVIFYLMRETVKNNEDTI